MFLQILTELADICRISKLTLPLLPVEIYSLASTLVGALVMFFFLFTFYNIGEGDKSCSILKKN